MKAKDLIDLPDSQLTVKYKVIEVPLSGRTLAINIAEPFIMVKAMGTTNGNDYILFAGNSFTWSNANKKYQTYIKNNYGSYHSSAGAQGYSGGIQENDILNTLIDKKEFITDKLSITADAVIQNDSTMLIGIIYLTTKKS